MECCWPLLGVCLLTLARGKYSKPKKYHILMCVYILPAIVLFDGGALSLKTSNILTKRIVYHVSYVIAILDSLHA